MYTLKNDRLTVTVSRAEHVDNCRFDKAGFVTDVTLDGEFKFLAQEDMLDGSPSSGGKGLCCEYTFDPLSAEVAVGEKYPKTGVGILTKTEATPYFFMNKYPCEGYDITVDAREDCIVFVTAPKEMGGYAVEQKKVISIEQNRLIMTTTLKNVGTKDYIVDEYCHNFMTLNRKRVNKDYRLEIPCVEIPEGEIKTNAIATFFHSDGKSLSKSEESSVFALYAFEKNQMKPIDGAYGWKLTDTTNGLTVTETDDFEVDRVTVWSVGDAISPEMFFHKELKPGEEATWSRSYEFLSNRA